MMFHAAAVVIGACWQLTVAAMASCRGECAACSCHRCACACCWRFDYALQWLVHQIFHHLLFSGMRNAAARLR